MGRRTGGLIWPLLSLELISGPIYLYPVGSNSFSPTYRSPTRRDQLLRDRSSTSLRAGDADAEAGGQSLLPAPSTSVVPNIAKSLGPNAPKPGILRRAFPAFPWHRVPDVLTTFRCLAIPALVGVFYLPNRHIETASLFAFASFTDWLDGYLARRWDVTSAFGAFLDPVADKLMVSTALILLSGRYGAPVAVFTAIILAREIAVSALREWMAQRGLRDTVKVGMQGKVKTALTMIALTVFLLVPVDREGSLGSLYDPALVLLFLCTGITVTSGMVYFQAAAPVLLSS